MQNAKGKAKFKILQCKSQGCVWSTGSGQDDRWCKAAHGRASPWIPAHRSCLWHYPVLWCVALLLPHDIFQLYILLKQSSLLLFVSQNMRFFLMLSNRNTLLSSRTEQCQGQEAFPSHFSCPLKQSVNCGNCWKVVGRYRPRWNGAKTNTDF